MGTALTSTRGTFYGYSQTALVSSFTAPAITNAIRVVSCDVVYEGGSIERDDYDGPHEGGLKPLPGPSRYYFQVQFELRPSPQAIPIFASAPITIDDSGGPAVLTPSANRLPFNGGEFVPGTFAWYERNGKRYGLYNAHATIKAQAEAGGIWMVDAEIHGQSIPTAVATTDDVAQVVDAQITGAADGDWVILVKDDTGRSVSATYSASSDTVNATASGIEAALETARGSETWFTETVSTDTIQITSATAGVPLTVTVTAPGAGTSSVSDDTANLNFSSLPSFQNDGEEPITFFGSTITHQVDGNDVLNVTSLAWDPGYTISMKRVGGDASGSASGFANPRVSGKVRPTISVSCDMQSGDDFDVHQVWAAGTEVTLTNVSDELTLATAQAVIMDPSETETDDDRGWDYTLRLYGDGTDSNAWSITLA